MFEKIYMNKWTPGGTSESVWLRRTHCVNFEQDISCFYVLLCKLLKYGRELGILKHWEVLNWGLSANQVCGRSEGGAPGCTKGCWCHHGAQNHTTEMKNERDRISGEQWSHAWLFHRISCQMNLLMSFLLPNSKRKGKEKDAVSSIACAMWRFHWVRNPA